MIAMFVSYQDAADRFRRNITLIHPAAEFFAAALDEYDAAVIVGQPTTGKGYFQSTFELDDGSAVGLSIGKYTTPNGVSLADVGITPEIVVELDEERKAAMVSNLLVVLCGNRDAQPVVNSGSLY